MARYISFAVLLAIIVVIGALFYKVMIGFFVPVFLAAVLVVVFRPLHRWVCSKVGERDHLAAGITTAMIILIVLMPVGLVLTMAAIQGAGFVKDFNLSSIQYGLAKLRTNDWINLEYPHADVVREIQDKVDDIQSEVAEKRSYAELTDDKQRLQGDVNEIRRLMGALIPKLQESSLRDVERQIADARKKKGDSHQEPSQLHSELQKSFALFADDVKAMFSAQKEMLIAEKESSESADVNKKSLDDAKKKFDDLFAQAMEKPTGPVDSLSQSELAMVQAVRNKFFDEAVEWNRSVFKFNQSLNQLSPKTNPQLGDIVELQKEVLLLSQVWKDVRNTLSGGPWVGLLKDLANPSREQVSDLTSSLIEYLRPRLLTFTGDSATFLVRIAIGATILLLCLYFFLCDGPAMVRTIMELSPLDDRYELELLAEFDRISRAIVLATVLSALVQGLAAGIGYYFVGMPSLVLLIALTCTCALIPFVGPALVWVPVCIYIAVYRENITAAVGLALWGMLVVASLDNVVKMFVLHGQSQLHPLLALLSVLGGIQALGPIGILIGPMVVVLLQTLLGILRHELTKFKKQEEGGDDVTLADVRDLSGIIRKAKVTIIDNSKESTIPPKTESSIETTTSPVAPSGEPN